MDNSAIIVPMWPFSLPKEAKTSSGKDLEGSYQLRELVYDQGLRIKTIERGLEELHDFVRRLAARRAKEQPTNGRVETRKTVLDGAEEDIDPEGISTSKRILWAKARARKNEFVS